MSEDCIKVEDLNVLYGENNLLKDINVEIPKKKITVIIGPSGCGKTIFLRCFNRFIDFNDDVKASGKLLVEGVNILDKSVDVIDLRRMMGMISQKPYPLPMSIYDNVAYGPRIHGEKDKAKLDQAVKENLETVGLWDEVKDRLNEPGTKLSLGQQQRLCLARILSVKPKVLLCDEITSALDPVSSHKIEQQIAKLRNTYTIIMTTHNIHQAKRLADYVIYLYLGSIVEHGPAKEVFKNPKDARTRAYLNGEYYVEYKYDSEVNLKGIASPENFRLAKEAIDKIKIGHVLRIIVDGRASLHEIPDGLEIDGQKTLQRRKINDTDWEIFVRKVE